MSDRRHRRDRPHPQQSPCSSASQAPWTTTAAAGEARPGTPKAHNKRRPPCDFESLRRSLKRVRLSSGGGSISPGELRLRRDLRHAVTSHRWTPVGEEAWSVAPPPGGDPSEERRSVAATVSREDPMELVLSIRRPHQATTNLHLSFPRRYPHQPPTVRRIEYQSSTEQQQQHYSHPQNRYFASSWYVRSSGGNCDEHGAAAALQKIIIAASPEEAAEFAAAGPGTVLIENWSPVQRLTDVCEWLIAAVLSRRPQQPHCPSSSSSSSSSSLSIQCPSSFASSSSSGDGDDGPATSVHRNGTLSTLTAAAQQRSLMETATGSPDGAARDPMRQNRTENNLEQWNLRERGVSDDSSVVVDDIPMLPDPGNEYFLPPGRFNVGYDEEQHQPVTMMMDLDET